MTKLTINTLISSLIKEGVPIRTTEVARAAGTSRQAAHRQIRARVRRGDLRRVGGGRSAFYLPVTLIRSRYPIAGLAEDQVWTERLGVVPGLDVLGEDAVGVLQYAFTELLNNAIDHSGAQDVDVVFEPGEPLAFEIVDEGIGAFESVLAAKGLRSHLEAAQDLTKGKMTSQPDRHTGEGIFFVSKAADLFILSCNGLRLEVDNVREDVAILRDDREVGTRARFVMNPNAPRSLRALFDEYTDELRFNRTRTVVKLFSIGVRFVSRSEARRLMHGLDRFQYVILDFEGVEGVGQGFADEVLRVWPSDHPDVQVTAVNTNEPVAFMLDRAR